MASEVSVTGSISVSKGGAQVEASKSVVADLNGDILIDVVQFVITTAVAADVGQMGSPDWIFFVNLDPTNYVEASLNNDGSAPFARMLPGESAGPFRSAGGVYYLIAHTAPCNVNVVAAGPIS